MSIFYPTAMFNSVCEITPELLKSKNIKGLILDVDNTLTSHNSQELSKEISTWLNLMKSENIKLTIASNNTKKRVEPLANALGLEFVSMALKPLTSGCKRARKNMGLEKNEIAMVGDQLFTDVLAGKFYGIHSFLVVPLAPEIKKSIAFKRKLEKPILEKYIKSLSK